MAGSVSDLDGLCRLEEREFVDVGDRDVGVDISVEIVGFVAVVDVV